jgi:pimeloyl-ACP methyl ester carboxylesterase
MRLRKLNAAVFTLVLLFSIISTAQTQDAVSWPPLPEAVAALESNCRVTVKTVIVPEWPEGSNFYYAFEPNGRQRKAGFIFYPGALVDPRSYAPTAQAIAAQGYVTVIVKMVGDLAILSPDRASVVISDYPDIKTWVIGGHSFGGAIACSYAKNFPDMVQGVVLWAAYPSPAFSIRDTSIKVISIFGTNDGLATPEEIEASRADLPPDTKFVAIEGGNHTQFGWYDTYPNPVQPDDNSPDITRQKQQCQIIYHTVEFLEHVNRKQCAATYLLGKQDHRLSALRQFRDTVLIKSALGKSLIEVYYDSSQSMIALFEQRPAIRISAKKMLELLILVLQFPSCF